VVDYFDLEVRYKRRAATTDLLSVFGSATPRAFLRFRFGSCTIVGTYRAAAVESRCLRQREVWLSSECHRAPQNSVRAHAKIRRFLH